MLFVPLIPQSCLILCLHLSSPQVVLLFFSRSPGSSSRHFLCALHCFAEQEKLNPEAKAWSGLCPVTGPSSSAAAVVFPDVSSSLSFVLFPQWLCCSLLLFLYWALGLLCDFINKNISPRTHLKKKNKARLLCL